MTEHPATAWTFTFPVREYYKWEKKICRSWPEASGSSYNRLRQCESQLEKIHEIIIFNNVRYLITKLKFKNYKYEIELYTYVDRTNLRTIPEDSDTGLLLNRTRMLDHICRPVNTRAPTDFPDILVEKYSQYVSMSFNRKQWRLDTMQQNISLDGTIYR